MANCVCGCFAAGGGRCERCRHLAILGLSHTATAQEVRGAWHRKIKTLHPDKFTHAGEGQKRYAEKATKDLNVAYAYLRLHPDPPPPQPQPQAEAKPKPEPRKETTRPWQAPHFDNPPPPPPPVDHAAWQSPYEEPQPAYHQAEWAEETITWEPRPKPPSLRSRIAAYFADCLASLQPKPIGLGRVMVLVLFVASVFTAAWIMYPSGHPAAAATGVRQPANPKRIHRRRSHHKAHHQPRRRSSNATGEYIPYPDNS